ncbi:hypothetical protein [Gimesia maris]|uniref:hypothetical protein n=1 Tax=Gimesia maris TaxID=122 RepID=UPI0032ED7258
MKKSNKERLEPDQNLRKFLATASEAYEKLPSFKQGVLTASSLSWSHEQKKSQDSSQNEK